MTRLQYLFTSLIVSNCCLTALTVHAQVVVWQAGQASFPKVESEPVATTEAGEQLEPGVKLLLLTAAAEPTPALKFRLWVSPSLRRPGDAMAALRQAQIAYLTHPERAAAEATYSANSSEDQSWHEMSLAKLADSGVREYLAQQRDVLNQVYLATSLSAIPPADPSGLPRGMAATNNLLSEQQNNRTLARLVSLDARLAMAEGRFAAAIDSIAAGFRLAELTHAGAPPTILTRLISLAISGMMLGSVEELSQQPGAPNLYWALASLPAELWDLRSALDGETASMARVVYPLLEPIVVGTSQRDLNHRLVECVQTFAAADGDPFEGTAYPAGPPAQQANIASASKLLAGIIVLVFADASRQELSALGLQPNDKLSHTEVTLRAIQLGFARGRDNIFKWGLTPMGIGGEFLAEMNWLSGGADSLRPANIMLGLLVPALQAVESANMRTNSQHKQLLLREALRGYAAVHEGRLPTTIDSLQPMPAWPNPVTGQMFEYQRLSEQAASIRREPLYSGEKQIEVRVEIK